MIRGNILIVDDEESVRTVLKEYLANIGYVVVTADSGEDALQKFIPGKFDSVISDLMMPKMDGMELLKQIRQKDTNVVFLMITGYPSIESAIEAIKAGAYDYVTKPFKFEDVKIKLERGLYARNLEKSLKNVNGLMWGLIISIPIWLILGIVLGLVWRWI
ncbi:MAG: response regulator [Syntrophobacterales bacterium]|nr:response regulator [Syntrophobacterales bacterium]